MSVRPSLSKGSKGESVSCLSLVPGVVSPRCSLAIAAIIPVSLGLLLHTTSSLASLVVLEGAQSYGLGPP